MLFYHNRPGFNYLKYLEDKSHFDGLKISVRNDIKDLVSSDRELSQNHISVARDISESISDSTDRIVSSLDSGFSNLAVSIDDVRSSVDNLSSICEIGFSVLDLHLTNLNESIRELVRIAKTPDQTWAFEQFEIARDAYRRNLYEESLEYIDRAIDGYKDRSGFKLEHRFHLLRGHIHLGNERNYSLKLVNLNLAYDDFINAAKYAEYDHKPAMAKAMQLAGWTSYCSGNIGNAEKHLLDSLSTESNSETAFILSESDS
jgi:hypothetical protein